MILLSELVDYLDRELELGKVVGDEPNGLLVKGSDEIARVGLATNCSPEAIKRAAQKHIQLLVTHHGGWRSFDLHLIDEKKSMLKQSRMSLYVAHACLDNSEKFGTGNVLAETLGVALRGRFAEYCGGKAGVYGDVEKQSFRQFLQKVSRIPGARITSWRNRSEPVKRIGIVTGEGYKTLWVEEAASFGCGTYLTGEGSMFTTIFAKERGLNLVFAGHTATERPAMLSLGKHLR